MNDNRDPQLEALFHAVRAAAPDTTCVEYGFETRLLARLREERGTTIFSWAWKLCPFFAALALAAGWWGSLSIAQVETTASAVREVAMAGDDRTLLSFVTGGRR
jgi:hypothetical protein